MRLLIDVEELGWDEAWDITTRTFGYTNHTVLPEALERWPVALLGQLLPRHLQIIYEINERFLGRVRARFGPDDARARRMSLIEEDGERRVRMAPSPSWAATASTGSPSCTREILRKPRLPRLRTSCGRRSSATRPTASPSGAGCSSAIPSSPRSISDAIGSGWTTDLYQLTGSPRSPATPPSSRVWRAVKRQNKLRLADNIRRQYERRGIAARVDPDSLFDVQVKRIHEYKRQLLNVLHVVTLYNRIKDDPGATRCRARSSSGARPPPATPWPSSSSGSSTPWRGGERRPRMPATGSRWSSSPTTGCRWPRRSSRPPSCPSRSPRRAPRPRAPAT